MYESSKVNCTSVFSREQFVKEKILEKHHNCTSVFFHHIYQSSKVNSYCTSPREKFLKEKLFH